MLRAIDPPVKTCARCLRARSVPLTDFLESHLLDDLPLGRVHHRDDPFHSDDGVERLEPNRSVGISRRLCHRQFADPFSARLDRRLRQQAQTRDPLPVSGSGRRCTDAVEQLTLGAVVFYRPLQRARRIDPGLLGLGGRLLRPQILRHDPRQYESLLHLGRHPRPLRRRRDLRPHGKLRAGIYWHHDRAADFHRDDGAPDQAVGETGTSARTPIH